MKNCIEKAKKTSLNKKSLLQIRRARNQHPKIVAQCVFLILMMMRKPVIRVVLTKFHQLRKRRVRKNLLRR